MNYKKINNLTGWVVCLIACCVYLMTKEHSASFWDCGEFLSGSYKLEVVHSPGAPLFLLLGRIFTMFGDKMHAAANVNTLSALASGFTILFLFWSITHFAKRIMQFRNQDINETGNLIGIMMAGAVGALAYTFSDTFWFSAVEGEVYSLSSFLTALVFWAILKWDESLKNRNEDGTATTANKYADRWIIFIAYIMGLSIGVHLLNLLVIPAIIMVYYLNRYKVSSMGTLWAFLAGCAITGLVQFGIIQGIPIMASQADLFFVNSVGLPFNVGVLIFFLLFVILLVFVMRWAKNAGHYKTHLSMLCIIFIMVGYSSFLQTIIRSNADVPIDMTNPDNALSLIKYLQREQYGNTPLVFGPDFNSRPTGIKEGKMDYWKNEKTGHYDEMGKGRDDYEFSSDDKRLFPRVWDMNDPRHVTFYKQYLGLADGESPSSGDNISFFVRYQMIQMYWRYFLWNYVGRQNDTQNLSGEPDCANWLSGIKFIDKAFGHGDTDLLPNGIKDNRTRNELFALPFILGLLGLFFHIKHDKRNALVVGLLFFFTGAAIVIYLNNTPLQPRERDYAYVGSMFAFAIWIGLGVLQVRDWLLKIGSAPSSFIAGVVCLLAVPVLMCSKEWDDHDRSHKTLAPASARNFLESCEKNAILFTEGDNDTYPLWYLQEIEGVRTDIRIINLSLLGIDWYIDQLNYKTNDADAVAMRWTPEKYRGRNRNYLQVAENKAISQGKPVNLNDLLDFMNSDEPGAKTQGNDGVPVNYVPTRNVFMTKGGAGDTSGLIQFQLPGDMLLKNDLGILNILASNYGKRPIYFSNTVDPKHYEGLFAYVMQEGLVYKLTNKFTPGVQNNTARPPFNTQKSYDLFMKTFKYGGAERNDVYFDQPNRRMLSIMRNAASSLADALIQEGKKKEAVEVLDACSKGISEKSMPITFGDEDRGMIYFSDAYLRAGAKDKAKAMNDKFIKYVKDDMKYYNALPEESASKKMKEQDVRSGIQGLGYLMQITHTSDSTYSNEIMNQVQALAQESKLNFANK
jgi:hypothetical protein